MEGSEKINGKKRLPSIPSNYVTLLQLQERWVKEQERKQKEKEESEEPQREQEEREKRVGDEVTGRESPKNGHFRRYDRGTGKPKEEEIAVSFAVNGSEDVEKEKEGEELKTKKKKKKKKKWSDERKKKKEEKAGTEKEAVGPAVNAPPPARVENSKLEEEVIGDEVHAPTQASVETGRELNPGIINRTKDRTAEIGGRFRAMSMKGEMRSHRGENRGDYGKYGRRRGGGDQRSEGMVWVKKGGVSDGIKSSTSSSKALD